MPLHKSTFEFLKPSDAQIASMAAVRQAAAEYASVVGANVPDGADKTFLLRNHRSNAMWANVAITREADGAPRE